MSTRRAFLGTLGKALGAGGVLLPWAGKGALALPADLGKAASLPVTPTPLPVSAEMLRLREIRRELHSIYLATPDDYPKQDRPDEFGSRDGRTKAWREVMRGKHTPAVAEIVGRKKPTWQDCVEIAEIALHRMHRHGPDREGRHPAQARLGRAERGRHRGSVRPRDRRVLGEGLLGGGGILPLADPWEGPAMISPDFKRAYIEIEDDVCTVRAAAGVLHLAFHDLSESGKGQSALAQSLWFTAMGIEAACQRIAETLGGELEEPETGQLCAWDQEARQ